MMSPAHKMNVLYTEQNRSTIGVNVKSLTAITCQRKLNQPTKRNLNYGCDFFFQNIKISTLKQFLNATNKVSVDCITCTHPVQDGQQRTAFRKNSNRWTNMKFHASDLLLLFLNSFTFRDRNNIHNGINETRCRLSIFKMTLLNEQTIS